MKIKQKINAQGAVLIAGASRIWKFVKSNSPREYNVDLMGLVDEFSQQNWSFVRSTATRCHTFRRDLLLHLLNPYHIFSAVTALQAAAQLEVACLFFMSCVTSIYLSILIYIYFVSPGILAAAASFVG